jgi:2-phosphosulfolactate phosphatase
VRVADKARARRGAGGAGTDPRQRAHAGPRTPDLAPAAGGDAFSQAEHDLRFDWGSDGLAAVAAGAGVVVVVDVLRFTTAVSVAVGRGAVVLPYVWGVGDAAAAYARSHDAELAGEREHGAWSLSPTDLQSVPAGSRLVLPSPNGSTLAFGAADEGPGATVLAGCLRNARAVAGVAAAVPGPVAVVAAGERWHGDIGPVRPAVEDLVGAGAVLRRVADARGDAASLSPEAVAAVAAYEAVTGDLAGWLAATASGRELAARGWDDDVAVAATAVAEDVAPVLDGVEFRAVTPGDARPIG